MGSPLQVQLQPQRPESLFFTTHTQYFKILPFLLNTSNSSTSAIIIILDQFTILNSLDYCNYNLVSFSPLHLFNFYSVLQSSFQHHQHIKEMLSLTSQTNISLFIECVIHSRHSSKQVRCINIIFSHPTSSIQNFLKPVIIIFCR